MISDSNTLPIEAYNPDQLDIIHKWVPSSSPVLLCCNLALIAMAPPTSRQLILAAWQYLSLARQTFISARDS
jgi:hypothetical protein